MNPRNNNGREGGNDDWNWWLVGAAVAGTAAAIGLFLYKEAHSDTTEADDSQSTSRENRREQPLININRSLDFCGARAECSDELVVPNSAVPARPCIRNLNAMLEDIHVRYIALKEDEFKLHYSVFCEVFSALHNQMKTVDKYYERYSSNIQFAGSHFDGLRIKKPDEFDMDIVIRLPVNMDEHPTNPEKSDIVIEKKYPGFVQLRAGVQYQNLPKRDREDWLINRAAYEWLDDKKYILRSKFTDWFKSVGNRALNRFEYSYGRSVYYVNGLCYTIRTSSSGPAWTIIIEREGFRLDVDLVPALKFHEDRWLDGRGYRRIPDECRRGYWMVVPKPNKSGATDHDEFRSWRVAMQDQEKVLLHNTYHLRQVIRLLKKLRDSQDMKKIASYYIKTLFFWELVENWDRSFWQRYDVATLFKYMLKKFYDVLDNKKIPYFWNRSNNMIENLNDSILNGYKYRIKKLLEVLENPSNYRTVAKYLLTADEYEEYLEILGNQANL